LAGAGIGGDAGGRKGIKFTLHGLIPPDFWGGVKSHRVNQASKIHKPDGLFLLHATDLPEVLHGLTLRDLNGIGQSMETRLHAAGIHSVAELCACPKQVLRGVWGNGFGINSGVMKCLN